MSLCQSIDTLSMAFLDDELAGQERRELELHLLECASCREHVDAERADLELVRKALVAPPAPALLKARITRALDAEDAEAARRARRQWSQWLLPGSAIAAAAAAMLVFFGAGSPSAHDRPQPALVDIARQQKTQPPLEVQGASTGVWLRDHFAPVEPPQFTDPGIELLGARLLPNGIAGHDAALLQYRVAIGANRVTLTSIVLKDFRADLFGGGQAYQIGDLVIRLHNADGMPAVTYVDPRDNVGYVFASQRLTAGELLQLVGSTDLIARAQQRR